MVPWPVEPLQVLITDDSRPLASIGEVSVVGAKLWPSVTTATSATAQVSSSCSA